MTWNQIQDGDEVFPEMEGYQLKCCDCGLVHQIDLKVYKLVAKEQDQLTIKETRQKMQVSLTFKRIQDGQV
jgi:hypothetical protein